jgi:hypothetical protein
MITCRLRNIKQLVMHNMFVVLTTNHRTGGLYYSLFLQNMKEELKCLASAVTSVSALFTQFDSPDVSNDALSKELFL